MACARCTSPEDGGESSAEDGRTVGLLLPPSTAQALGRGNKSKIILNILFTIT